MKYLGAGLDKAEGKKIHKAMWAVLWLLLLFLVLQVIL